MDVNDELILLERVFLRLGSADTDEQLESTLGKFLAPVLLKLASQVEGVRKKVMELLVHVNKRVKSRPKIQLPVNDLLTQYLDSNVSPFVTNFTILYIKMGYGRLPGDQQALHLPRLIECIKGRPEPQQISLLQLIIAALQYIKIPKTDDEKKSFFLSRLDLSDSSWKLLLMFMQDVLLLPYNYSSRMNQVSNGAAVEGTADAAAPSGSAGPTELPPVVAKPSPPPGMSVNSLKRVLGDTPLTGDELEKMKLSIVNLLGCGILPEHLTVCHLVAASADVRHGVATLADLKLKQLMGGDDWNKSSLVSQLYALFLGTVAAKGQNIKPENKITPSGIQLRLKIFPYLLKSREAASQFPSCVQVVFDCLFGSNTNSRLKSMGVQFVHHLCLSSPDAVFNTMSSLLLSGMVRLSDDLKEDVKLRCLAYVGIGKVGQRVPHLITKDLSIVQKLFDGLSKGDLETKSAIQETLSLLSQSFGNLDQVKMKQMEALVMQNIEKPEVQCRLMAVRYANTVFPSDHVPSRYVLLLACGDNKEEIFTEASKSLKTLPTNDQTSPNEKEDEKRESKRTKLGPLMPPFVEMITYIHEKAAERIKGPHRYVISNIVLAFNPVAYIEVLLYLRMCLAYSAGVVPAIDSTSAMQEQAPSVAHYVRQLLAESSDDKSPISIYLGIARQLLNTLNGTPAMYCLLEMVAMARSCLSSQFYKHSNWIQGFMFSTREDMRGYASELYAIVTVDCQSLDRLTDVIQELTANLKNQPLETQHGSLLCLGYTIGQSLSNQRRLTSHPEGMDLGQNDRLAVSTSEAVREIVGLLDSSQLFLSIGACLALGEIGRNGALPIPETASDAALTKSSLVEKLIGKLQSTKENNKMRESVAVCLGNICVGEPEFSQRRNVIDGLMNAAAAKQFELHCTIGDALVCAAQGSRSPSGRDIWTCTEDDYQSPFSTASDDVAELLRLLLEKYLRSSDQHVRQAACIWLSVVVKKCGSYTVIQNEIMKIQSAFVSLLGENNELTQDVVSKGLGIVYDKCNAEQRKELVAALVDTLTTGKRKKLEVTEDTQLFQEGSLGKTPEGQSMSTYKELCSIANDLNQPDLIYKFMHLANHNATWNAKKGAAFGFSTIASQASEQLAPHLDKIVPKLYRYQFDPNPRIQGAMSSIWNALVTDNQKTVAKYMKEILDDLLKNLTSNQWRIRESSCLALNDLLRGRPLDDIVDELPSLWQTCFRVRDDIKESVRNAADLALKTLSRASIRLCDVGYGKSGEHAMGILLTCLLESGLGSPVEEVRAISLSTIMKISKGAGILIKPHIPVLIVALLESMTTLEPQLFNYLSLHAASNRTTQDKLDSARMAAFKTSPMMEVVTMCVPFVDASVLVELVPRMTELIKSGVGLGTKVGCASFLISISRQCPQDLGPYSGKFLSSLLNGMSDRNSSIRKSYAAAIGHIVKVSKDASVERLVTKLTTWYLEKDDETIRESCSFTIRAINQYSPDVLKAHSAMVLPLVFLAMHNKVNTESNDTNNMTDVDSSWEEVWLEATPGMEGGLRLYLMEIVAMTKTALASQSWQMKAQAALSMKTVADKLGANLGPPHLGMLLTALVDSLQGRTWVGKEFLLKALSTICTSCKESVSVSVENQPSLDEILTIAIKECKKEKIKYKMEALRCTSAILEAHNLDRFEEMSDILYSMLASKEEKDEDAIEEKLNRAEKLEIEECIYELIGNCWPQDKDTQLSEQQKLSDVLVRALGNVTWKMEVIVLQTLGKFISRLSAFKDADSIAEHEVFLSKFFEQLISPFCSSLANTKYGSIRTETMTILEIIIRRLNDCGRMTAIVDDSWHQLQTALISVKENDSDADLQRRAQQLLPVISTQLLSRNYSNIH